MRKKTWRRNENVRSWNEGTGFFPCRIRTETSTHWRSIAEKGDPVFLPQGQYPGCSKQACGFGELYPQFVEKGAVVLGVSKDSVASHKRFEEKYGLPFTLLSDTELSCIQAYDVWKEKKMYGKVGMGVVRTTYLINENGIIEKAYDKVKAADNPAQMLGELA